MKCSTITLAQAIEDDECALREECEPRLLESCASLLGWGDDGETVFVVADDGQRMTCGDVMAALEERDADRASCFDAEPVSWAERIREDHAKNWRLK